MRYHARPNRTLLLYWSLLLVLLATVWVTPAQAMEPRTGEVVTVAAGQVIDDDLFAAGRTITIGGQVRGDLYAFGNTIVILRGAEITGDLIAAGEAVVIDGTVGGDVRVAGSNLTVAGPVGHNVSAAGATINLSPNAAVKGSWTSASSNLLLHGQVDRDTTAAAGAVQIGGTIGRNVHLEVERSLVVQPTARIGGNVTYTMEAEQSIPSDVVRGTIQHQQPDSSRRRPAATSQRFPDGEFIFSLILMLGTVIVGLLIAWLAPNLYRSAQAVVERRALMAFGVGLVTLLVLPVIAILLMITVLGIPLGLVSLGVWALGWFVGWLLAATALAGIVIGLLRRDHPPLAIAWLVIVGVVGLYLLTSIPILGGLLGFATLCLGLGTLVLIVNDRLRPPTPRQPVPSPPPAAI